MITNPTSYCNLKTLFLMTCIKQYFLSMYTFTTSVKLSLQTNDPQYQRSQRKLHQTIT